MPDCALFSVMCDSSETDTASETDSQDFSISKEQDAQGEEVAMFKNLEILSHSEHDNALSCPKCKVFYEAFIKVSLEQAMVLESTTRKQSLEPLWHDAGKLRITASTASKVPQRHTTDPVKFITNHLYPKFKGNVSTKYGMASEKFAKEDIKGRGCVILEKGLVVCAHDPWLAASPDGVIDDTLLEVKCPITLRDCSSLNDAITEANLDVGIVDGRYIINPKGSQGYYRQVQLGMHCLGLQKACLVIWTPAQHLELNVPYDKDFVASLMQRLRSFYFRHMLPKLVDGGHGRKTTAEQ